MEEKETALSFAAGCWGLAGGGGGGRIQGLHQQSARVYGQGERGDGVSTAARAVVCISLPVTDVPCIPSPCSHSILHPIPCFCSTLQPIACSRSTLQPIPSHPIPCSCSILHPIPSPAHAPSCIPSHPIPSPAPAPSRIPPPAFPGLRTTHRCSTDAPFVAQAALLPPLRVLLPIQNLLACNLLSSGTLLRGELTSKCKQTNTPTTKQRSRDAVDPDRSSSEGSQFSGVLIWIPFRSCFGAGCAHTAATPHLGAAGADKIGVN